MKTDSPTNELSPGEEARLYPYARRNLRVLPFANGLSSMGFALCWPFLPLMMLSLGVRDNLETWVGYMMLVFYVISFLSGPVWGGLADSFGRKIMILRAMLGMGVFMSLIPFAPTPLWFAFLFALVGFFNGANMSSQALLVANTPPARIGSGLSLLQTGALVGQTMGPALGTFLAAVIDKPHWMFWISGGLLLTGGGLVTIWVREIKQLTPGPWRPQWIGSLRELVAGPRVGVLFYLSFVFAMLWTGSVTILSIFVLRILETQPGGAGSVVFWAGAVAMGLSLSSVVALPFWGRVLDRWGAERVLTMATAAAALTQLPLLFLETPLQLVLTRVAFGLSACAMLPSIVRLLRNYVRPGMDARAISYSASFQFIAMGLAPFCAGMIGPAWGLRAYFALTTVLTIVGLVLWIRSGRQTAVQ